MLISCICIAFSTIFSKQLSCIWPGQLWPSFEQTIFTKLPVKDGSCCLDINASVACLINRQSGSQQLPTAILHVGWVIFEKKRSDFWKKAYRMDLFLNEIIDSSGVLHELERPLSSALDIASPYSKKFLLSGIIALLRWYIRVRSQNGRDVRIVAVILSTGGHYIGMAKN